MKKVNINIFRHIWILFIMLFIGILMGIANNKFGSEFFIKDIFYMIKPLVCILCGYYIMYFIKDLKKLLTIVLVTSTLLSILRIMQFV